MQYPDLSLVCNTVQGSIDLILENFPPDGIIVESGTYIGNTAAYIVNKLLEAGKTFKFFTVDNFQFDNVGTEWVSRDSICLGNRVLVRDDGGRDSYVSEHGGYDYYKRNIDDLGVTPYITTLIRDSLLAPEYFEDKSLYCVILDDSHSGKHVSKQIELYLPKMAKNSLLIGDDCYPGSEPKQSFDDAFNERVHHVHFGGFHCGCYVRID